MKKIIYNLLFALLFVNTYILTIIFETNNLQSILKHLSITTNKKDTIIVFDIDHTIAALEIDLDSWIPNNIKKLEQAGLNKNDAISCTLNQYFTLQNFLELNPIGNSQKIIKQLQDQNFPVMALTNRSIPVAKRTIKQLSKKMINLETTSPTKDTFYLPVKYNCKFSNGILFAASNDKGKALFTLFKKIGYKPKKIIFIDDKLKYVNSVEKEAAKNNIEFIGIRFSLQDELKKKFNMDKVEQKIHDLKVKIGLAQIQKANITNIHCDNKI